VIGRIYREFFPGDILVRFQSFDLNGEVVKKFFVRMESEQVHWFKIG
jgi:hypothetical protein